MYGSGRDMSRDINGYVTGIRTPPIHGIILQIPGEGAHGRY